MYEKIFWVQYFSDDSRWCIVRNYRDSLEKLYTLVNGADGRNVFCNIIQDIQKNRVMFTVDKMYYRQCSYNFDGIFVGIFVQYKDEAEGMGLFKTADEFSWTDMPVVQLFVGDTDYSDTCTVRTDKP